MENTTEVVMDAQVMKMTHELLGTMVQTMDNTEISDDEFVAAIVSSHNVMGGVISGLQQFCLIIRRIEQLVATAIGIN